MRKIYSFRRMFFKIYCRIEWLQGINYENNGSR